MACKSDLTGLRNSSVALTSVSIEGCPAIALNLRTKCAWTMNEQLELYQFFDRVLKRYQLKSRYSNITITAGDTASCI